MLRLNIHHWDKVYVVLWIGFLSAMQFRVGVRLDIYINWKKGLSCDRVRYPIWNAG